MANSQTLGSFSTPRMRGADIEVPNRAVDRDSRARQACYPRSSFCPLIFAPPTWTHRFTKFEFPLCAARTPCSQAGLCLCTSNPVSIRIKPTLVSASVTFWEASAPDKLPTRHCPPLKAGLGISLNKGGVSLLLRQAYAIGAPTYAQHV